MTATAIAQAVQAGTSAVPGIEACLTRLGSDQGNAVLRSYGESALNAARRVDARVAAGELLPLAGVPVLLKDNICHQGHRVEASSRILQNFTAPYSATAVQRLEAAGAVIVGTANMDEFAMGSSSETGVHGRVKHPRDPARVAGGSSGGSAAAVAAGLVPLALGSDTGGSIRQPAAFCGCVGIKPSYGTVSRHGLLAFGSSLDQIGPLANNVADAALALTMMAGHDPLDGTSRQQPAPTVQPTSLKDLRIGIIPAHRDGVQPAVAAALDRARHALEQAGARIVEVSLPRERLAVAVYYVIATGEAASNLSRYDGVHYGRRAPEARDLDAIYRDSRGQGFGAEVKRRILLGTWVLSAGYVDAYYRQALRVRRLLANDFAAAFAACDVLLGPVAPTTAFRAGEKTADPLTMYLSDIFTISANLAGLPALSLPVGADAEGLPTAVQLQAAPGRDGTLLGVAQELERLLG